jgi:hypothetical protein
MKELKKASDWYNATTHTITSAFSYYIVANLVVGLIVGATLGAQNTAMVLVTYLLEIVAVWLAVYFSSQFLKGRYLIDALAKQHIAKLSTIYIGILFLLYVIIRFAVGGTSGLQFIVSLVSFVPHIIVFYFASKKYLPITATSPASAPTSTNV